MRWPGSWHRKAAPVLCRNTVVNPDQEIDLDTAFKALAAAAPHTSTGQGNGPDQANTSSDWNELILGILTGKSFHGPLVQLAAKLIRSGMDDGAAVNMLARHDEGGERAAG